MSVKNIVVPGVPVVKAAQGLPATTTSTLFTVTGAIMVTGLIGRVTAALGATATSLSLGIGSSNTALATATVVTSAAQNTLLVPTTTGSPPVAAGLSQGLAAFVSGIPALMTPLITASNITWTTNATDTGQIEWYLWYVPFDTGSVS